MDSPSDWPSLADELELADELFGHRGYDLVASWLERQAARVDDPDLARLFSDHIDIPGVTTDDYLHRRTRSSSGTALGGIGFLRTRYQSPIRRDHRSQLQ